MFIRKMAAVLMVILSLGAKLVPQSMGKDLPRTPPKETIDQMWKRATAGEFLPPNGWAMYSGYFLHPLPADHKKIIRIVSNSWGVFTAYTNGTDAQVSVGCAAIGTIDAALKFTPAPPNPYAKAVCVFNLVLAPTRSEIYMAGSNGRTAEQQHQGPPAWQIVDAQGPAFTTVNTAIRYVLQTEKATENPAIKKNAEKALSILLRSQ